MKKVVIGLVALLVALTSLPLLSTFAVPSEPRQEFKLNLLGFPMANASTTSATSFVLQNLGVTTATVAVEYRNTSGTNTNSLSGLFIGPGAALNFDQRYPGIGDPGTNPFQGSVIASSDQQLGSVVNIIRNSTSGGVTSLESYNGFGATEVGTSVRILQVLKGISSGGVTYNTSIAVQNTDIASSANITLTFTPDPVLCVPLACSAGAPFSVNASIAAGGTYILDQSTQGGTIGSKFFGSVLVAANKPVAVVTLSDGGEQVLLAYPSFASGATSPIVGPSIFKNIVSLGDSYSTACIVANMGNSTANITVQYIPASGAYTVSGTDTFTVPVNSIKNIDQRYDAPSITSGTFIGAAVIAPTNGVPIAGMCNLRGGSKYAMTYGMLTGGGNTIFLPVGYKNISSLGVSYSSTYVVYNFGTSTATVNFNYFPNAGGSISGGSDTIPPGGVLQVDLRYHATTSSFSTFFGAAKLTSNQPIGVVVQSRGSGVVGDYLFAYRGLVQ